MDLIGIFDGWRVTGPSKSPPSMRFDIRASEPAFFLVVSTKVAN
jgi:hypothetical protein